MPPPTPQMEEECEITALKIIRTGFAIDYMRAHSTTRFGHDLDTGVCLEVATGAKPVVDIKATTPGVSEGLDDMASDGLEGRMILYGLAFKFVRV
ncbi:Uu.00g112290.m01.CDS01 [Anthostomella pinea]|uniref:Uu.00g112290.m01.CDS01 n=1 Tax=Anthostomella pinea TaxID=933095 RepID=A0AAI8VG76_9PEZI|nr:Uu.00g112290.m01.CDS01 [Anthostomella pinea]